MKRRDLFALAALLPVLASPANACSVALRNPRLTGLENNQVRRLFEAWWMREEDKFRSLFTKLLMDDGQAMDLALAQELLEGDPIPEASYTIFKDHFTDVGTSKEIVFIVNTAAGCIVGCSEESRTQSIGADCSGMPLLHLFHVTMFGINPRTVRHIESVLNVEPGKVDIWAGG